MGLQNPNSHISHHLPPLCPNLCPDLCPSLLAGDIFAEEPLLAAGTWQNSTELRLTSSGVAVLQQVQQVPGVRADPDFPANVDC